MQRRIKQLIDNARDPMPAAVAVPARPKFEYNKEIELAIKADFLAKRTYTYEEAADKIGWSPEKMRVVAREYYILRGSRPHRIPECILKLIIRDNVTLA